jgi:phosphate:Na+ symporter
MVKDIYSANIEFISRAQAAAPSEFAERFAALRRANMDIVAAIKATKHLRKNLHVYSRGIDKNMRREYNRFRVRVGSVLREIGALREQDDRVVALLSLDRIKVETLDADNHASRIVDKLIRQGEISSQMATSLINDGAYTRELVGRLLDVARDLIQASTPHGEALGDEMSLQIEDIANIARSLDGAALPGEMEDYQ